MSANPKAPRHALSVLAPAKINLFLHVTGRRADGYHLLQSLFSFADVGDKVSLELAEELSFSVSGPFAGVCKKSGCDGDSNIVVAAAKGLQNLLGDPMAGCAITLEKNLPLSSGLGGGSSDAAATLKALQIFWGREAEPRALFDLALKLGADVPACLVGEPCLVSGIGEETAAVPDFPDFPCVLVNPNRPLATPAVFKTFTTREFPFTPPLPLDAARLGDVEELMARTRNDLQGPACGLVPDVGKVLMALERAPGARHARMSGSGATCFALFDRREGAEEAARAIATANSGWWVKAATLRRQPPFALGS
jgi:4-diphosphocytidyl-2-C-methyl-D-erythritol kinase